MSGKRFLGQRVSKAVDQFSTNMVNNLVIEVVDTKYNEYKRRLEDALVKTIFTELVYMAGKIMNIANLPIKQGFSQDVLEFQAGKSSTSTAGPLRTPVADLMMPWKKRSTTYVDRKIREVGHDRWFFTSGKMLGELSEPGRYIRHYGPIRVSFMRQRGSRVAPVGTNNRANIGTRVVRPSDIVTTPHVGRRPKQIHAAIGTLRVQALNKITPGMLANPEQLLAGWSDYTKTRLLGPPTYRQVLEPFLTWFVTRAVPNAIQKRLDNVLSNRVGSA